MVNESESENKKIKIQKVDDQQDYEKSGFKSIMEDVEETKKQTLESIPQIPREQVPSGEETTKELLEGSSENKKKAKKPRH
jgi:hypothetical protein